MFNEEALTVLIALSHKSDCDLNCAAEMSFALSFRESRSLRLSSSRLDR